LNRRMFSRVAELSKAMGVNQASDIGSNSGLTMLMIAESI
jgi:hypothetical protein